MASTLFASRNEVHWGERGVYMKKNPRAVSGAATTTSSSSNPNPRPYATPIVGPNNPNNHHQNRGGEPVALELSPRSDDGSSFSHQPSNLHGFNHQKEPSAGGAYVVFNVSSYSRKELRDLKRRLIGELERVRDIAKWIESRDFRNRSGGFGAPGGYGEPREATSAVVARPHLAPFDSRPVARSDLSKQKKVPQGSVNKSGNKRPPPPVVSPREPKRAGGVEVAMGETEKLMSSMIRKCKQILTKLLKHKYGYIFKEPVDAVRMGLHDYHQIVKQPMDLGTVKTRLCKNLYPSPIEFADDVRLTFNNALLYNPAGNEVHAIAEKLLQLFEDLFTPALEEFEKQQREIGRGREFEMQRNHVPVNLPSVSAPPTKASTPRPVPPVPSLVSQQSPSPMPQHPQVRSARPAIGKQPKPKAKDPNKREMSYEEKQKLSVGLESLPHEKMAQVLLIVRRKNPDLKVLNGGEIELDFETLNTETLWDLDRFVSNCKKNMSKMRRQEMLNAAAAVPPVPVVSGATNNVEDKAPALVGDGPETVAMKNRRVGAGAEQGEEDVDIGDEEMPSGHFPPVEIEKDDGNDSSSSGSTSNSSSSSSSSDSDSRSSSDSESDGNEAQSPAVGSRPRPPQPPRS